MDDKNDDQFKISIRLPLLPLRDVVVFPRMIIPLFVGRDKSIAALNLAMKSNRKILLVAQKNAQDDDPDMDGLHDIGTIATILQLLKLPDGTVKVLIEGEKRVLLNQVIRGEQYLHANVSSTPVNELKENARVIALSKALLQLFQKYSKLSKKISSEIFATVTETQKASHSADIIASHITMRIEDKQKVLKMVELEQRQTFLIEMLETEIELLEVEKQVRSRVKKQMENSQREYYLTEQMKAIQKELGTDEDQDELVKLKGEIDAISMPKEAKDKLSTEFNKLKKMSPMSAEATVVRSYIDWMINIPWKKRSRINRNLQTAEKVLNIDHYGLEDVKERILEYLAVQQRTRKLKGPVLCLVGPPGVGKTSLGKSIAHAINRHFIRIALGGVRDEAEIRGHRRTYIGSMPGRIIQKISKAGVKNPLILLDEIDKMGSDMRGDPASALLEVLDSEQNHSFNDHYLEVDYDLSDAMFICTSNSMDIPAPLLDRMEIIRIPGYTEDEKANISRNHLIPKQLLNNGVKKGELAFDDAAILHLIRYYTKEAGVRGMEREISKLCRKVVKEHVLSADKSEAKVISADDIEHFNGVKKYTHGLAEEQNQVGIVTGLAWTSVGGELLNIEAVLMPGKGKVVKTGSLGDVMQESIQAALTVVRSRAAKMNIDVDFHEKKDLHIHVPEGATPKDGPSAGAAMCISMISVLTDTPIRADVAMTGEINLRGQILLIGGLKEKLLAAHRGGIKKAIIPYENIKDLQEVPDTIKKNLKIYPVKCIEEVMDIALQCMPESTKKCREREVVVMDGAQPAENKRINTH